MQFPLFVQRKSAELVKKIAEFFSGAGFNCDMQNIDVFRCILIFYN